MSYQDVSQDRTIKTTTSLNVLNVYKKEISINRDILNSTVPRDFAYAVARKIIEALEKDFSIPKPLEIPENKV